MLAGLRLIPEDAATLPALTQEVLCWARTGDTPDMRVRINTCWGRHVWVPAEVCEQYGPPPFTSLGQPIACPGQAMRVYTIAATDVTARDLATCLPLVAQVLPAPAGLAVTAVTDVQADLTWSAVDGAVGYQVRYRAAGASAWTELPPAGTATTAQLTGLTGSTSYDVQVRALGDGQVWATGPYSATVAAATAAPLAAPTGLAAVGQTSSSIEVTWTPVAGAASYVVAWSVAGQGTWTEGPAGGTNRNIPGLAASTAYDIRVKAVAAGWADSPWSAVITESTTA